MGYVRKRGNSWSFTVDIEKDPVTGRRKQKTKSGFASEKEAKKAMRDFLYEYERGLLQEKSPVTVKEYAIDWLDMQRRRVKRTTWLQYERDVKQYIVPILGDMRVTDLKPIHGERFLNKLSERMSAGSARNIFGRICSILDKAAAHELIVKNPFTHVERPKVKRAEVSFWTFDELHAFLAAVDDPFYYALFFVASHTGMRRGELLGLRWKDISLEKRYIRVVQNAQYVKGEVLVNTPKTDVSRRQIAIDERTADVLAQQRIYVEGMKALYGSDYAENDLIFPRPDGRFINPVMTRRAMQRYMQLADVKTIRFHDLRHTHATLLLALGVNIKIIAERLGHKDVMETLRTYSHVVDGMQQDAIDTFSRKMWSKSWSRNDQLGLGG